VRLLSMLGAEDMPRGASIAIDSTALGFSALVAVLSGLAFGSIPVFHLFRRDLNAVFRQTERSGTAQRHAVWTRSALVVCQVSLAFVLLAGAGLLTASFARLLSVDPGFKAEQVLSARFSMPSPRYDDDARARAFASTLLERVRAIPGVKAAGATTYLPFGGNQNASAITIVGYALGPGETPPVPGYNYIDAGYLEALSIPILQGRSFSESDGPDSRRVVIIDEFMARKYWPKRNAIGGQLRRYMSEEDKPWTIVGVAGMVKTGNLAEQNPVGHIYFPMQQAPQRTMHLVVKTHRPDPQVASAIRRELVRSDAELALFDVKTMPERLAASVADRKAAMVLCVSFGILALLLSAIGIYGVLAYAVAQRTREFGIRVALGASVKDVLGMVVGQGVKLAAVGLAIGAVAAVALTRLMTTLLYGVEPGDPRVFATVTVLLAVVALLASFIPSVRALRIRPGVALRYE
ncbi:MAG TPA: FtsX-like permease family protein, partial [Bryobacteraceae bacterium]|nr:FtsX-like permease family protein [Bryobacteraceae bacterium]